MSKVLAKLLQQLLPNKQAAAKTTIWITFEPMDGLSNFKKVKWSELNFKCIELPTSDQAATKAAATAAT